MISVVQIIGAKVACEDGMKDTWRETAAWAAKQLASRYSDAVRVEYYDLFDPRCPPLPKGAKLPLVMVDGQIVNCGGKISIPAIRKKLEESSALV